jgi:hypothetical protein
MAAEPRQRDDVNEPMQAQEAPEVPEAPAPSDHAPADTNADEQP